MSELYGRLGRVTTLPAPESLPAADIRALYDQNGVKTVEAVDGLLKFIGTSVSHISNLTEVNRECLQLRGKLDAFSPGNDGAGINVYGDADSTNPGQIVFFTNGWSRFKMLLNGYFGVGEEHDPRTPIELFEASEDAIIAITAANDALYDAFLQFKNGTGATPPVKYSLGIDTNDSCKLKIFAGTTIRGSSSFVFFEGKMGIGIATPITSLHIKTVDAVAPAVRIEGNCSGQITSSISANREILEIRAKETLANGAGINVYGNSDSTSPGGIILNTGNSTSLNVKSDGGILYPKIKSGATQVAAGAAANELWKTSGHATLPNNVVMIGV